MKIYSRIILLATVAAVIINREAIGSTISNVAHRIFSGLTSVLSAAQTSGLILPITIFAVTNLTFMRLNALAKALINTIMITTFVAVGIIGLKGSLAFGGVAFLLCCSQFAKSRRMTLEVN